MTKPTCRSDRWRRPGNAASHRTNGAKQDSSGPSIKTRSRSQICTLAHNRQHEGNDDLVRVVQARRESCATTFAPMQRSRGLWCEHPNARTLLDAGHQALLDNRLMAKHPDAIPDADRAYIPDEKVFGYALNPEHGSGKHKAKVFASALGFTQANAAELKILLLQALPSLKAIPKGADGYGQRFEVDIPVTGPGGSAVVRTGWIIDRMGEDPRLTSLYVRGGEE